MGTKGVFECLLSSSLLSVYGKSHFSNCNWVLGKRLSPKLWQVSGYQGNMRLDKSHWNKWKISGKMRQSSLKCAQAIHRLFHKIIPETVCTVGGVKAALYFFSPCTARGSEPDLFIYCAWEGEKSTLERQSLLIASSVRHCCLPKNSDDLPLSLLDGSRSWANADGRAQNPEIPGAC